MKRGAVGVVTSTHSSPKHAARDALEKATPADLGTDCRGMVVLFKLVARLNHARQSTICWPSQDTISADTGIPVRTLRRVLEQLRRGGLIRIHRDIDRYQANEYVIDVEALCRRAGIEYSRPCGPIQRELGPMLVAVGRRDR